VQTCLSILIVHVAIAQNEQAKVHSNQVRETEMHTKNASHGPNINGSGIVSGTQQNLRSSVPESNDLRDQNADQTLIRHI